MKHPHFPETRRIQRQPKASKLPQRPSEVAEPSCPRLVHFSSGVRAVQPVNSPNQSMRVGMLSVAMEFRHLLCRSLTLCVNRHLPLSLIVYSESLC